MGFRARVGGQPPEYSLVVRFTSKVVDFTATIIRRIVENEVFSVYVIFA
jgi:hypothetical protein